MDRSEAPTVIVVSHICPFPVVHGNRSRLVALLAWLRSRGLRVVFVLQPLDVDQGSGLTELAKAVDRLEVIRSPYERSRIISFARRALSRVVRQVLSPSARARLRGTLPSRSSQPAPVMQRWGSGDVSGDGHIDRWCWLETAAAVRRLAAKLQPSAVITEYALLSKCLDGLPSQVLRIIDTVEVFFRNRERFEVQGLAAPFVCTSESEKLALDRADVLIGIQNNEAEALKHLFPHKRVITVGHTYPLVGGLVRNPSRGAVLYVGSSNPFNVHGLRLFLEHAWPRIRQVLPEARLRIVGSCPRVEGVDSRGVIHVGRVSDEALRREYETAHVVINPQVAGTGLKIKCVEALSSGCPMVMNQAGADGLEDGAGKAFLLARDWGEFVSHVLSVVKDDGLRASLEQEAQRLAGRLFSVEATFSGLSLALQRAPDRQLAVRP